MNKLFNLKNAFVGLVSVSVILISGCTKEKVSTSAGAGEYRPVKKVSLNEQQSRDASDMYSRMPRLRYWDEHHNRFIEMNPGSRDLVFSDPDAGFSFSDPDGNNAMVFSDVNGSYFVFSSGIGVAGQGGGGTVIAGPSFLNMDVTVCFSAEEIAGGDGFGSLFGDNSGWSGFGAVFGISGDFEGLSNANTDDPDFNPFEYLNGFAEYFVFSDDLEGSHDVFDWMDGVDDTEDLASSFVMDFQSMDLYFANGGEINVDGGTMTFDGTYLRISDLFESFLNDDGVEDAQVEEVSGFGSMGCN